MFDLVVRFLSLKIVQKEAQVLFNTML